MQENDEFLDVTYSKINLSTQLTGAVTKHDSKIFDFGILSLQISKLLQIKSNLSLYLLYYAKACKKLAGLISASFCLGNAAPFEEMSQRLGAVGNSVQFDRPEI